MMKPQLNLKLFLKFLPTHTHTYTQIHTYVVMYVSTDIRVHKRLGVRSKSGLTLYSVNSLAARFSIP